MTIDWTELQTKLLQLLLDGDTAGSVTLARQALDQGASSTDFFNHCIIPVLVEIGNRFENLDIFLPEMMQAAEIVQEINDQVINPALEQSSSTINAAPQGKVLLATVQGDLHDIGKSMVALLLRVNGFKVIDLGTDVAPATIVEQAEKEQVDIIGLSALLTTCLPYMKDTVDYLREMGRRDVYRVIIGGAAPTEDFAAQLGVDGYGHSAAEAVTMCRQLMTQQA